MLTKLVELLMIATLANSVVLPPRVVPAYYGDYVGFPGPVNGYGRHIYDGDYVKETAGNAKRLNQRMQGIRGGHISAKESGGSGELYHGAAESNFNQDRGGATSVASSYGSSAKGGFDGVGRSGHKKGHRTSGFHKSYHNVESGKDTKFIEEDHNLGEQSMNEEFDKGYNDKAFDYYQNDHRGGKHAENLAVDGGRRGDLKFRQEWDDRNGYLNDRQLAHKDAVQSKHANNIGYGHFEDEEPYYGPY